MVAPALTVMAIILFMGKVSGAHLNPAVSIAFALRKDFQWRRVPGYIVAQLGGATLAALVLHAIINVSAKYGSNYPAHGYSDMAAFWMELLLTAGLVSVILGTASGAQNVGIFGALGVGGYIALAGLWGSPISGASMNPARTFGPDLVSLTFTGYWVYIAGPLAGAVIVVAIAFVLRGAGGGESVPEPHKGTCSPSRMSLESPSGLGPPHRSVPVNGGHELKTSSTELSRLGRCELAELEDDMVLCHFIVSEDVERSRRFYTEVLGGKVVFSGSVTNVNVALANGFIVINIGGGPTDDKPTVTLETPRNPDRTSSFLNIRVKDIQAKYEEWSAR